MLLAALCVEEKRCKVMITSCKQSEIPNRATAKVSIDLIVGLPTSQYGNKDILVMVDHPTRRPIA